MNNTNNIKIFIIAGEASGDNLGSKLMKSLIAKNPSIKFYGIGGNKMTAQGLDSIFPMNELSIMGFSEILPYIPKFLFRIYQTISAIKKIRPNLIVTIDSPGFNFRIAKKIKKFGIKLVHYVAPTVWAYKPERAKKIAAIYDYLLVLLPWEANYFSREGLTTYFIGHPIIEDYTTINNSDFRTKYNISDEQKIICLLPGSRKKEIERLLPIFKEAVSILSKDLKNLVIAIPTLPHLQDLVKIYMSDSSIKTIITINEIERREAIFASDAAIVKSGTVTFDVAMAKIPMIVAYKVSPLSAYIIRKLIKTPYVNLINIINKKEVIPEYLQEKCTPEILAEGLYKLLCDQNIKAAQFKATEKAFRELGYGLSPTPSEKATDIIIKILGSQI
ncbi:MAG: lipid-A-disaccharide synthase [Alphaproteobacteria bacterium]